MKATAPVRWVVLAVLLTGVAVAAFFFPIRRYCGHTTPLGFTYGPGAISHCCRSGKRLVGVRMVRSALEHYRHKRGTYPASVEELKRTLYIEPDLAPAYTEGLDYRRAGGTYTLVSLDQRSGAISYLMQADGVVRYGTDGVVTPDSPRLTADASNQTDGSGAAGDSEGREE
jgi:hypothetical protein